MAFYCQMAHHAKHPGQNDPEEDVITPFSESPADFVPSTVFEEDEWMTAWLSLMIYRDLTCRLKRFAYESMTKLAIKKRNMVKITPSSGEIKNRFWREKYLSNVCYSKFSQASGSIMPFNMILSLVF